MRMIQGLLGAVTGGAKWVLGGVAGAWTANRFWPGAQGAVQNTAGDVAEAGVEIESGAAAQNGNIDNFFAGRNALQGALGWLSGLFSAIHKFTNWEWAKNAANGLAEHRADEQAVIQAEVAKMGETSLTNPGSSPLLDNTNQNPSAPEGTPPTADTNGGADALISAAGIGAGLAAVAAPSLVKKGYTAMTTPKGPDLNKMTPDQVLNHLADQERGGSSRPAVTAQAGEANNVGHGKGALLRNMIITGATVAIPTALSVVAANAEEVPNAGVSTSVLADQPELALAQAEAVEVEAMAQEVSVVEAEVDAGFDLAGEVGHFAHVAGHGLQNGLIDLAASPENLWDMVDGWTGGALWGDHETSSTTDSLQGAAPIPMPEIRNDFDAAIHGGAQLATWLIPVGGALKAAGASAKVVNGVRAFEVTENAVNTAAIGTGVATVGAVASDAYLGTHFMTAANGGQIVPVNPMAVYNPNAGAAGMPAPQANSNGKLDLAM